MSKHKDFEDFKATVRKLGSEFFGKDHKAYGAMAFGFMSARGHTREEAMFAAGFTAEMSKDGGLFEGETIN